MCVHVCVCVCVCMHARVCDRSSVVTGCDCSVAPSVMRFEKGEAVSVIRNMDSGVDGLMDARGGSCRLRHPENSRGS